MKIGHYQPTSKHILRWVMHFPAGGFIAYATLRIDSNLGWQILVLFLAYEIMEGWRVKDWSFIDVFGALIFLIGGGYTIHYWF